MQVAERIDVTFVTVMDPTSPHGGGAATKEIIRAFCRNETMNTSIICPEPENNLPNEIRERASALYYLPPRTNPGSALWHGKEQLSLLRQLLSNIRRENPDLIVSRMSSSLAAPPILAAIFDIPYIPLIRGRIIRNDKYRSTKFAFLVKIIYRLNIKIGCLSYVPIKEIKDTIQRMDSSFPVEVFPNAVNPELFQATSIEKAREQIDYDLDSDDFVVGFVGSLNGRHRLQELIEGFSEGIADDARSKLLIVGGSEDKGEEIGAIRAIAEDAGVNDRILFTGPVAHERVPLLLSACDILYGVSDPTVPTAPVKLYEYLACERRVITTSQPELSFVGEHNLGYVLSTISSETVSRALHQAKSEGREKLLQEGERGREYVSEYHTWDKLPEMISEKMSRCLVKEK